jgi:hypothetical protein
MRSHQAELRSWMADQPGLALLLTVVLVGGALCVRVPAALLGDDVDEDGAGGLGALDVVEDGDEVVDAVAVHGADVIESELLEERGAGAADHAARVLVHLRRQLVHRPADLLCHSLKARAHTK